MPWPSAARSSSVAVKASSSASARASRRDRSRSSIGGPRDQLPEGVLALGRFGPRLGLGAVGVIDPGLDLLDDPPQLLAHARPAVPAAPIQRLDQVVLGHRVLAEEVVPLVRR